ncbi:MAG: insulinase family protein [Bacteroidales bacterium]|nr:insulinase family protein [Bacteroidales bacterium]
MNKLLCILVAVLCGSVVFSQKNKSLEVVNYELPNGLSVYLNEDPNASVVLGAIAIKTGGKYDPADHTGTSHYLEHMMFKGTDEIGTIDYKAEKVYLDSIVMKYDELAATTDDARRKDIQKEINALSLKAGKYAIPNELDKLLDGMGATMVNAFTSDEVVAYFNAFPVGQMEKWMELYSHRFKHPVFRLFQSELETVFEEKNMYADEFSSNLMESFMSYFYKKHPYGTQTVIGKSDHIKNPSLSTMQKMYDTYYVANNMALIMTGNFKVSDVKPLIEKYFGEWRKGEVPQYPKYDEKPFNGVESVEVALTPVRMGVLGYRTVTMNDKDKYALSICQTLLNNSSSTGYLDKLMNDRKLLAAMAIDYEHLDHGGMMILYVPKILGQKFEDAEALVVNEINRLRTEEVDKEWLESIKLEMIKDFESEMEDPEMRAYKMGECFLSGTKWDEVLAYPKIIESITPDDIKKVAEKYLNENYLSYHSKMGFPKKDKLDKPGFDPVVPENAEVSSEYAKKFEEMPVKSMTPKFVKEGDDYEYVEINKGVDLYYSKFEQNDIFNLEIKFKTGLKNNPKYEQLASYLQYIGTSKYTNDELNKELQKYAASYSVSVDDNYFTVYVDGFNKYFKESVGLILSLLNEAKADDSKLERIVEEDAMDRKMERESTDDIASALLQYGIFGENSKYLRRASAKEVSKMTSDDMMNALKQVKSYPFTVHYSGRLGIDEILSFVKNITGGSVAKKNVTPKIIPTKLDEEFPKILPTKEYAENTILFLNDSKALQSKIYFYIQGDVLDEKQMANQDAFNQYFGTGMSSIVFQEIREFRSMAYTAYAVSRTGLTKKEKSKFMAFVGTQSDKTIDAISVMTGLINNMPMKDQRMRGVKDYLMQSLLTSSPSKREITETVERWKLFGYNEDPRIMQYDIYNSLDFVHIVDFYKQNIHGRPILITIVGNKKKIDMKELAKYGKIVEVKQKTIMN